MIGHGESAVSSLNLAVPQGAAIFLPGVAQPPHVEPGASAARPASVPTQSLFDYSSRTTSQGNSCAGGRRNPGSRGVFGEGFGSAARRIAYSGRPRFNSPASKKADSATRGRIAAVHNVGG